MRKFIRGVTFALAASSAALADESVGSLTLKTASDAKVIVDGAVWKCLGEMCAATNVKSQPPLRVCQRVVAQLGQATAFTFRGKSLSEAELAECNASAKK